MTDTNETLELNLTSQEMLEILSDPTKLKKFNEEHFPDKPKITHDQQLINVLARNQKLYIVGQEALRLKNETDCLNLAAQAPSGTSSMAHLISDYHDSFITEFVRSLGSREIIGVQPLNGPIGLTYHLEVQFQDNVRDVSTPEKESKKPNPFNALNIPENRKLSLNLVQTAIEALSRRLQTSITIEAMRDLEEMHGLDLQEEMRAIVAQEIAAEYNAMAYNDLIHLAGPHKVLDLACSEDGDGIYTPAARLAVELNRTYNRIGMETRRGRGNWIVVPPEAVDFLRDNSNMMHFVDHHPQDEDSTGNLFLVGFLNDTTKVYCYSHAQDDTILIGYKGSSDTDVGYMLAPYVIATSTGVVVDPTTYAPKVQLMTRYGVNVHPNGESYYSVLKVQNAPWMKADDETNSNASSKESLTRSDNADRLHCGEEFKKSNTKHHQKQFENAMRVVEGLKKLIN